MSNTHNFNAQAITLATGGNLTVSNGGTTSTISGVIAGTGATLVKYGLGRLTLSANNTYTGETNLTGFVRFNKSVVSGAPSPFGNSTTAINLWGGNFSPINPGTNAANGSSLIWLSECQVRYTMGCLDLLAQGVRTLEVRQDVHDAYHKATQEELLTMVWSHPAVSSYYKHADGRIYTVMPWRNIDYWHWTQAPNPDDLVLDRRPPP